jgi:hypothetical protein
MKSRLGSGPGAATFTTPERSSRPCKKTLDEGECPEQAFVREVAEDACAQVMELVYLGCQEVIGESGHRWTPSRCSRCRLN